MTSIEDLQAKIIVGDADLTRLNKAVNDPPGTFTTDEGIEVSNLRQRLLDVGYDVPVTFASGISVTNATQTVEYDGLVYAPLNAELPFTTTGTFDPTQWYLLTGNFSSTARSELQFPTDADATDWIGTYGAVAVEGFRITSPTKVWTKTGSVWIEQMTVLDALNFAAGKMDDAADVVTVEHIDIKTLGYLTGETDDDGTFAKLQSGVLEKFRIRRDTGQIREKWRYTVTLQSAGTGAVETFTFPEAFPSRGRWVQATPHVSTGNFFVVAAELDGVNNETGFEYQIQTLAGAGVAGFATFIAEGY